MGEVLTPDGKLRWRREAVIELGAHPHEASAALGRKLGLEIREEAGEAFQPDSVAAPAW